ncbi:LysR family transcriptional regulator [Xanthobacter pseudotagetidis]|uniref:LysR family transcriptional regulator n=1 Tax=Xanthobacter pseudotagetidis TaxID=3119911 RepID=UPI00372CD823
MRFDLVDLRLFLAVVEAGSITHGAAEAGLSLPAASERLREMEAAGEARLLERGRRGVVPTAAGEALAHHARAILAQMAQMRGELGRHAKGLRASVRLLANTAALTELLPERLAPFMAAHPQIDVELKERQSVEIARAVAAGFADIGILSAGAETGALALRPFALDRLVAVVPRGDPLAARARVAFADLLERPFVGLMGGALPAHLDARAAAIGGRLRARIGMRTFEGVCRMVGAGVGVSIVPETAARRCRSSCGIATARLAEPWATRRLAVCVRRGDALSPQAEALFAHLACDHAWARAR